MKKSYLTDSFLNRFVPTALADFSSVQKIAICDHMGIKCADISALVRGSLLVKEGRQAPAELKRDCQADYVRINTDVRIGSTPI